MVNSTAEKDLNFKGKMILLGFGVIAKAVLPLLIKHLNLNASQIVIITKEEEGRAIAQSHQIEYHAICVTLENYLEVLTPFMHPGDFLLNLSVDISSKAVIELCERQHTLYLDTCIEPWDNFYNNPLISPSDRSNYAMRESVLALKKHQKTTAVVTHGANPGLVSHFVKQALMNLAADQGLTIEKPKTAQDWAILAKRLSIKVIHIAEKDTQVSHQVKKMDEFVNTWSCDGFIGEGSQPAELGWGSHERHWPIDGLRHTHGSQAAIYLNRPGASTRVRTWVPPYGSTHAFLITHAESISLADYLTIKSATDVDYRPTVHYAYCPSPDAISSVFELAGREWVSQSSHRHLLDEIDEGGDHLGVLLMGHEKGAYWFGSKLTVSEARQLVPHNNATTLQVAVGVLSGVIWAIKHPNSGIVEPEAMDFEEIIEIAKPYLGRLEGHYTDWTPLANRGILFEETLDHNDPWQFINFRVN